WQPLRAAAIASAAAGAVLARSRGSQPCSHTETQAHVGAQQHSPHRRTVLLRPPLRGRSSTTVHPPRGVIARAGRRECWCSGYLRRGALDSAVDGDGSRRPGGGRAEACAVDTPRQPRDNGCRVRCGIGASRYTRRKRPAKRGITAEGVR
ncbi:hypothetical protein DFH06DRAFT_1300468, partial [Mycena polygramma]